MYTQNPKKGVCASGGTYSTVGSGSVVLKLWREYSNVSASQQTQNICITFLQLRMLYKSYRHVLCLLSISISKRSQPLYSFAFPNI